MEENTAEGNTVEEKGFAYKKLLVRMTLVAILAIFAFAATFALENVSAKKTVTLVTEISYKDSRLNFPSFGYFNSEARDVKEVLTEVKSDSTNSSGEYIFKMSNGRIFGNFMNSNAKVNVRVGGNDKVGGVVIIPDFSMFEAKYDEKEGSLYLANFGGNTYVGFYPQNVKVEGYSDEYDGMLNNVLFIPAGMRTKIFIGRADDRLKTVLPSKLAKEFAYGRISYDSEKSVDLFDRKNLDEATSYNQSLKSHQREIFGILADQNTGAVSATYDLLSKTFTVFSQKKNTQYLSKLDRALYGALTTTDPLKMYERLMTFKALKDGMAEAGIDKEYYKKFINDVIASLIAFDSGDPEYKVLNFLIDESHEYLDPIYFADLTAASVARDIYIKKGVEKAYERSYGGVEKLLVGFDDPVKYQKVLSFYNEYFDTLLLHFPELYKFKYFEMKGIIEKQLYALYYTGQPKEEIKQSFVSKKIAMLKNLKNFFFEEKVAIEDARKVMSYLVESINNYMPAKTSKNAVMALFESELKDIGNFWGYINNVEYAKSDLYGSTHNERFKVYLAEKNQVTSILDVQRDILGTDVIVAETPADVKKEVERVFSSYGATSVVVEKLTDVQKRYVNVSAIIGGYEFNGEYDRDYGYLKNVYAYGQLISASNLKVDTLPDLLSKTLSGVVKTAGVDATKSVPKDASTEAKVVAETNAQKIAKTLIAKKVITAGFNATMENVDILDSTIALYRINSVSVTGITDTKVSFDYLANDGTVKNIYIQKGSQGKSLTGEVPFETLKNIVINEKI